MKRIGEFLIISFIALVLLQTVAIPKYKEYKVQQAAQLRAEKLQQAMEYMEERNHKAARPILMELYHEYDIPRSEMDLYWNYLNYVSLLRDLEEDADLETLYYDVIRVELDENDPFYSEYIAMSQPIQKAYEPIAEQKKKEQEDIAYYNHLLKELEERDRSLGIRGSSDTSSSKKGSSKSDPYDVDSFDDPDDFADEWAEEFGDGDEEGGWDDAWDYWEENH